MFAFWRGMLNSYWNGSPPTETIPTIRGTQQLKRQRLKPEGSLGSRNRNGGKLVSYYDRSQWNYQQWPHKIRTGSDSDQPRTHWKRSRFKRLGPSSSSVALLADRYAPSSDFV